MAIIIEPSYGKTIGRPGYSSHKFLVSERSEASPVEVVPVEAERVYRILQESVDRQNCGGDGPLLPGFEDGGCDPQAHISASPIKD